ncbi:MAG: hypothetical protein FWD60_09030 [Candidatus Azobacteroides sp.]|nr:hypothetical protein [Candidatus Azobacteroides sp.]
MEVFNGNICLTGAEITQVIPMGTFKSLINRSKIINLAGKACYGNPAYYSVDNFPHTYRTLLYEAFPELSNEQHRLEMIEEQNIVLQNILPDPNARKFFSEYFKAGGKPLSPEEQKKYENSAIILNAMRRVWERSYSRHAASGSVSKMRKGEFWRKMENMMPSISEKYLHQLPYNWRRLQDTAEAYAGNNYETLLNGRIGNKNRIKVTPKIESIVLSIYASKDKPFATEVLAKYNEFLLGMIDIVDRATGEIYDRNNFYKNGEPVTVSEGTVWKIINNPKNRRLVDSRRNDGLYNRKTHEPHHERKSPHFSFSKISMDDRDLTRKTTSNEKVCAYYAYDVASGCVIGASYSKHKNMDLVTDCFRDMFRFIGKHDLNMPGEVEVEHHLMNQLTDELNAMFPIVTFCAAGNSQQKRAEHFNRAKKYSAEKHLKQTNGRWWARSEAYRERSEREGAEYKEKRLPYSQLVAEDLEAITMYNNAKHPNQKEYPGMTRMDVLMNCQNPKLQKMNKPVCYRYFGYSQKTSLKRSKSVTVQYKEWWLPTPDLIDRFKSNNYECTAYYLPDQENNIESVFVYQGDRFIAECKEMGRYNESKIEQTDEDLAIMTEQAKYISQYRKMLKVGKEEKLNRLAIIPAERTEKALKNIVEIVDTSPLPEQEPEFAEYYAGLCEEDYAAMALNSI